MSRTWRRDLRSLVGQGPAGLSVAVQAQRLPRPVCEEETGELRGPQHGQKQAPTWDSIRESGIGMLANPAQVSGWADSDSSRQVHAANSTVGDRTWGRLGRQSNLWVRDVLAEHNGQFSSAKYCIVTAIYVPWHSTILDTSTMILVAYTILIGLCRTFSIFTDYSMNRKTAFLPRPSISILLGEVPENLGVVGTNLAWPNNAFLYAHDSAKHQQDPSQLTYFR